MVVLLPFYERLVLLLLGNPIFSSLKFYKKETDVSLKSMPEPKCQTSDSAVLPCH